MITIHMDIRVGAECEGNSEGDKGEGGKGDNG